MAYLVKFNWLGWGEPIQNNAISEITLLVETLSCLLGTKAKEYFWCHENQKHQRMFSVQLNAPPLSWFRGFVWTSTLECFFSWSCSEVISKISKHESRTSWTSNNAIKCSNAHKINRPKNLWSKIYFTIAMSRMWTLNFDHLRNRKTSIIGP